MNKDFDDCSYLSQVRKLRVLAHEVIKLYPLKAYHLEFVNHGENATFKVITKKKNYLLRIHCRSHRTKSAMLEELKWLKSLSSRTDLKVQKPLASKTKQFLVNVECSSMGHARLCDILEWQEGHIKSKKSPAIFYKVGLLIGSLQVNAIRTRHRQYWDTEGLVGKQATLGAVGELKEEFPKYSRRLEAARQILYKKLKNYERNNPSKMGLIHADLHFGNMIWREGEVKPIDFDDCGHGLRLYDLAVTLAQCGRYFKEVGKVEARSSKRALLMGYESFIELSEADLSILPYLVATRELAMLGWLYGRRDNPELFDHLKKNLAKGIRNIEKCIEQAHRGSYFS
jgi:Ser/Thr protein kinase RdoA (MazF antagonist)